MLTGLAALVAGAFSMGTGEYVSVTNQNELVHAEVALEADMHARFPAAEQAELADRFAATAPTPRPPPGWPPRSPATRTRRCALHTREELGVDPHDLPSPLLAGVASLLAFSLGALLPLLPYLIGLPALLAVALAHHRGGAAGRRDGRRAGSPAARCWRRACASSPWAPSPSR